MDGALRPHATERDRIEAMLPSPCVQNHAANLCCLPDGTLACDWFGGTMEGMGDIFVWMSRRAPGADHWSQAERLSDRADRSEQNPVLFVAPDGAVWLFHTSQPGGRQDACEIHCRRSGDDGRTFGPVSRLGDFTGVFVRRPPMIGPGGGMAFAGVSLHHAAAGPLGRVLGYCRDAGLAR
jgi:predicted neuraminidase